MSNKEEWEELEKWYKEKQDEEKRKFGMNISNEETQKKVQKGMKNVNIFVKILNVLGGFLNKIGKLGIAVLCIAVLAILSTTFSNINTKVDVDVINAIEPRYNIKIKELYQNKDTGKYMYKREDIGDIVFTAFKKGGNLTEDYSTRAHKYFFDKWQSKYKNDFIVVKKWDNELLIYETYIENFTNIEEATKKIIEFANFCGDEFMPNWHVYIKKGDIRIYPYTGKGQTTEDALKNAKETYNKYFK